MKKALVLGVMAIFAINVATVQSVKAQDKKTTTPKEKVEVKKVENKQGKEVAPEQTLQADPKNQNAKTAAPSTVKQSKNSVTNKPAQNQSVKKDNTKTATPNKEVNNTQKNTTNKNLNNSVPPKPKTQTQGTAPANTPKER